MGRPFELHILKHIVRLYISDIHGIENIPKDRSFIIAANHTSYMDIFIMPYIIVKFTKRMFSGLVNSRFFRNLFFVYFLNRYRSIPLSVGNHPGQEKGKINRAAFKKSLEMLKNKTNVIIFPEGTRSLTGKIQKGKTGIARLALLSHAPVLPVGIKGSYDIMPKGKILPRLKRAEVFIGKPMHFDKYYNKPITKKLLRTITDQIMKEIARLSGQRYLP